MGHEIETLLRERGHEVVLIVDADNTGDLDAEHLRNVDVALEFTSPATAYGNICRCLECGTAVVSGTTGWTDRLPDARALCDKTGGALFYASNYSLGVNLLNYLTKIAARILDDSYDVEIVEMHHKHKKDAPSGTADKLKEIVLKERGIGEDMVCYGRKGMVGERRVGEVGVHAVRGGSVVGDHTVIFAADGERLELVHKAADRAVFSKGAVRAALWLNDKPAALYGMDDVLNLK